MDTLEKIAEAVYDYVERIMIIREETTPNNDEEHE